MDLQFLFEKFMTCDGNCVKWKKQSGEKEMGRKSKLKLYRQIKPRKNTENYLLMRISTHQQTVTGTIHWVYFQLKL